jgi:hypothetical protein
MDAGRNFGTLRRYAAIRESSEYIADICMFERIPGEQQVKCDALLHSSHVGAPRATAMR